MDNAWLPVADVVWPALLFSTTYWTWWVILAGLVAELPVVVLVFKLPIRRAIVADVTMNLASATCGMVLLAIAGIGWEIFPGILIYRFWNVGTFNPLTWSVTFLGAVIITTVVEAFVLKYLFSAQVTRGRWSVLALTNAFTVGLTALELRWHPPQL